MFYSNGFICNRNLCLLYERVDDTGDSERSDRGYRALFSDPKTGEKRAVYFRGETRLLVKRLDMFDIVPAQIFFGR